MRPSYFKSTPQGSRLSIRSTAARLLVTDKNESIAARVEGRRRGAAAELREREETKREDSEIGRAIPRRERDDDRQWQYREWERPTWCTRNRADVQDAAKVAYWLLSELIIRQSAAVTRSGCHRCRYVVLLLLFPITTILASSSYLSLSIILIYNIIVIIPRLRVTT